MEVSEAESQVIVVGIDDSGESVYALEWTLGNLFSPLSPDPPFKLVLVHAKPSASSVIGLAGPGTRAIDVMPFVEADLKKNAARIAETAKELCISRKMNDPVIEVIEGDARNVLCEAVKRHKASILVVGSHGYGAIKRAFLGSVSDYCAHHAHCTVTIVKKPKDK